MFETVIGLEVHVQLNTKTKIFCSCATSFGEEANTNVCPTCLALPGALPVLNQEAVTKAAALGNAVGAKINQNSVFARKNYFYPDLPKAYQISQFEIPIVEGGHLIIDMGHGEHKTIGITRAHLEEDAGKNIHHGDVSHVDLNRAGTPLLEIVSEPDLRDPDEAVAYLKKLHAIVRYLDISDANMQEGSFRCDANVSIRPKGDEKLYTRVEIKNLNSFRFIHKAINYEVERQIEAWERGTYQNDVVQETRLFDTDKGVTRSMRTKEESSDYRYFPDPDLLPVEIPAEILENASKLPELPDEKQARYVNALGIKEDDAIIITDSVESARYFENMLQASISPQLAANWLCVELGGRLKGGMRIDECPVDANKLATLVKRIEDNTISGKSGKEILDYLFENSANTDLGIDEAIDKLGLKQISDDSAILAIIDRVIEQNPAQVEQYKAGKDKLLGFFVGQTMKELKGANPGVVNKLIKERLG